MSQIIHTNKENFEKAVLNSSVPVLVDFWASWCGPCRAQGSILERWAKNKTEDEVRIVKIDVDEEEELAAKYQVQSIPTLILFKDGEIINKAVGTRQEEELDRLINP